MTTKLAVAVAGAGLIGRRHCELIDQSGDCRLAAIVDPSPAGRAYAEARGTRWFAELDELLTKARPDGVILATPNTLHASGAIACLRRGVPVLIEKPVTDTVAAARLLIAEERRSGTPALVGHHRRHNPIVSRARDLIKGGGVGELTAVNALWLLKKPDDYFDVAWRREPGGGPVLINLIHDVDNLRFICGEIAEVSAMLGRAVRGFAVEDTASVNIRFANGALGAALISDATPAPWSWEVSSGENPVYPQRNENCYVFSGTRGSLALPRMERWRYDGKDGWWEPLSCERLAVAPADPLVRQLAHFCAVIRGDERPIITCRDAARTLAVIETIAKAAASGSRERVDPLEDESLAA